MATRCPGCDQPLDRTMLTTAGARCPGCDEGLGLVRRAAFLGAQVAAQAVAAAHREDWPRAAGLAGLAWHDLGVPAAGVLLARVFANEGRHVKALATLRTLRQDHAGDATLLAAAAALTTYCRGALTALAPPTDGQAESEPSPDSAPATAPGPQEGDPWTS